MTVITGHANIQRAGWMVLRAKIQLHIKVPAFDRRNVLAQCRQCGFTGKTLKQARAWVDGQCDDVGLARDAGLLKPRVDVQ